MSIMPRRGSPHGDAACPVRKAQVAVSGSSGAVDQVTPPSRMWPAPAHPTLRSHAAATLMHCGAGAGRHWRGCRDQIVRRHRRPGNQAALMGCSAQPDMMQEAGPDLAPASSSAASSRARTAPLAASLHADGRAAMRNRGRSDDQVGSAGIGQRYVRQIDARQQQHAMRRGAQRAVAERFNRAARVSRVAASSAEWQAHASTHTEYRGADRSSPARAEPDLREGRQASSSASAPCRGHRLGAIDLGQLAPIAMVVIWESSSATLEGIIPVLYPSVRSSMAASGTAVMPPPVDRRCQLWRQTPTGRLNLHRPRPAARAAVGGATGRRRRWRRDDADGVPRRHPASCAAATMAAR